MSQTKHEIEVQSVKAQFTALQSLQAIIPYQVPEPGAILSGGTGAKLYVLLDRDNTPIYLPYHKLVP